MANFAMTAHVLSSAFLVFSLLFSSSFLALGAEKDETTDGVFGRTLERKLRGLKKQKLSHFRLYWHDVVSAKNATSIEVVHKVNGSQTNFGLIQMFDNPLTEGPDIGSRLVSRAQGFYAQASQDEIALLMAENFVFLDGKYNGSTITVLGRNPIFNSGREMPIVGGSGLFRFATGYVQLKTYFVNTKTRDAIVEYNVYVMHY